MAALAQETAELAARVAEECKSLRTLINANSPDLSALNTSATNNLVAAVNEVWTITQSGVEWDNIQSKPLTFAPSAHKTSHATGGSDELTASDIGAAPTSHTHTASHISDSTATGRSLMTTANASAARTTLELGNAALATTSTGGNGSSDSGKVLAFGSNGDVRFAYFVLVGGSGTGTLSGTNLTGTRSYESPDANGTLALTSSTTGVPDNLVVSSTKTTPVDADSVLMTDSEAAGTPAKRLTFSNLWTWITTKLGGNLTIGGTKTWSGQQEATGQAATNGTSLMTRDLGDARYAQVQFVQLTANEDGITNSTSFKTSDTLKATLGVGTWMIEILAYGGGGASYATAGNKMQLSFSGTATIDGLVQGSTQAVALVSNYPNIRSTSGFMTSQANSTNSIARHWRGTAVVTVSGELALTFGCVVAVVGNTPQVAAGSYLMAVRSGS